MNIITNTSLILLLSTPSQIYAMETSSLQDCAPASFHGKETHKSLTMDQYIEPLIKDIKQYKAREIIRQVYKNMPKDEWEPFTQVTSYFFEKHIPCRYEKGRGQALLLEKFGHMAPGDLNPFINLLSTYFTANKPLFCYPLNRGQELQPILDLVTFLQKMTVKKRERLYKVVSPLFKETRDPRAHIEMLELMNKIPTKSRKSFINLCSPLIHDTDIQASVKIFELIKGIESKSQKYFVDLCSPFVQKITDNSIKPDILTFIAKLDPYDLKAFITLILQLLDHVPHNNDLLCVLHTLNKYEPEEWKDISELTLLICASILDKSLLTEIFQIVTSFPENELHSLMDPIRQIITLDNNVTITHVLKALKQIAPDERQQITPSLISLLQDINCSHIASDIIKGIQSIHSSNRTDFIKTFTPSLLLLSGGHSRAAVIKAHNLLKGTECGNLLNETTLSLFRELPESPTAVIKILKKHPEERHKDLIDKIIPLLHGIKNIRAREMILNVYNNMPEDEWEPFTQITSHFFEEHIPTYYWEGLVRACLIEEFNEIPLRNLEKFTQIISFYFKINKPLSYNLLNQHRELQPLRKFMKFLQKVPANKLENFCEITFPLFKETRDPDLHIRILMLMKRIHADSRKAFITLCAPLIQNVPPHTYVEMLEVIEKIDANLRQQFIDICLPLIQQISDESIKAKMLTFIANGNPKNTEAIIAASLQLFKHALHDDTIFKIISHFCASERSPHIKSMEMIANINNDIAIAHILQALKYFTCEEWERIIPSLIQLFQDIERPAMAKDIVQSIQGIPANDRSYFVTTVTPSLCLLSNGHIRAAMLRANDFFKAPEIALLINEITLPLFTMISINSSKILKILRIIPERRHEFLIEQTMPFMKNISNGKERAKILKIFKDMHEKDCHHFSNLAYPFMNAYTSNGYIGKVYPPLDRKYTCREVFTETKKYRRTAMNDIQYYMRIEILKKLKELYETDHEMLNDAMTIISPFYLDRISTFEIETNKYDLLLSAINTLKIYPSNARPALFQQIMGTFEREYLKHREQCHEEAS